MSQTGAQTQAIDRLRILIADDHPVIRKHVRSILEEHPRFEVCGEAHDGVQAIDAAKRLRPDVVVLNVSMPILSGMDAAREIKTEFPEVAIVILSSNADKHFVEEAKKVGARAYVAKTKAAEALVRAIEAAFIGGDFVLFEYAIVGPVVLDLQSGSAATLCRYKLKPNPLLAIGHALLSSSIACATELPGHRTNVALLVLGSNRGRATRGSQSPGRKSSQISRVLVPGFLHYGRKSGDRR